MVVQIDKAVGDKILYRVAIANKPGVNPYSPFLPASAVFEKSPEFRDWLLTKCNLQNATNELAKKKKKNLGTKYLNEFDFRDVVFADLDKS